MTSLVTPITYLGVSARVICDRLCEKAWGINLRPKIDLSEDPDDYVYLTDAQLPEAPLHPDSYEGSEGKPMHPDKHNKWCSRQCERSVLVGAGEPEKLPDFTRPVFNMPELHKGAGS